MNSICTRIEPAMTPSVLIVDDQPAMLNLLMAAFEPAGFNVFVALQGEMALSLLDRITPDVILLDAMMPGIDGFETCRRIKQRPALALVPVIFMTGLTETQHVVDALAAGGVDYVTKPLDPREVIARVTVHLANARLTRSAQSAMDASGRYLLAVTGQGGLRWTTQHAGTLLGSFAADGHLAPAVTQWLQARLAQTTAPDSMILPPESEASPRLEFAFIGQLGADEFLLRIVEIDTEQDLDRLHARVPLTRRESEVLLWLARGKSNRDIAQILAVSHRTINKHLEQIYPKLGVETRTSAVALAIRAMERA